MTFPNRSKCGHDKYWIGNYGTCMACRAERAELLNETSKEAVRQFTEKWRQAESALSEQVQITEGERIRRKSAEGFLAAARQAESELSSAKQQILSQMKSYEAQIAAAQERIKELSTENADVHAENVKLADALDAAQTRIELLEKLVEDIDKTWALHGASPEVRARIAALAAPSEPKEGA